jgi:hypothetical protein
MSDDNLEDSDLSSHKRHKFSDDNEEKNRL